MEINENEQQLTIEELGGEGEVKRRAQSGENKMIKNIKRIDSNILNHS